MRKLAQTLVIYIHSQTPFVEEYWIYQTENAISVNATTFNFVKRASFRVKSVIYKKIQQIMVHQYEPSQVFTVFFYTNLRSHDHM